MFRKNILLVTALALLVGLGVGYMTGQENTGKDTTEAGKDGKETKRDADKEAIEQLTKNLIKAFNKRDAAAMCAYWTADGEFIRNDGEAIHGRDNIEKGYADYFKTLKSNPKVEVEFDNLRFPSADTAISEVTLRLKDDAGEEVGSAWRNTLLVRENGKWKVAIVREWDRDVAYDVNLKELDWLIGTWHAANKKRELTLVYEWDENKVFIHGKYTVKEGGKVVESGTQVIGKDNAEGAIRSWVFQSDGGFGGGIWTREGKKWSVDVYGALADGRELTMTSIYVRVDADNFTWQAVDQVFDGESIPDTKPIKVTRQKSPK